MLWASFGVLSQNTGFYPSLDRIIETTLGPLNLGHRGGSYNEPISRLHRPPATGHKGDPEPTHLTAPTRSHSTSTIAWSTLSHCSDMVRLSSARASDSWFTSSSACQSLRLVQMGWTA